MNAVRHIVEMVLLLTVVASVAWVARAKAADPAPTSAPAIAYVDQYEARVYADANGEKLSYRLLKPKDYDQSKKYPLVLFLHGSGERGGDNLVQLKNGVSEFFADPKARAAFPCFAVVPQCPSRSTWCDWRNPDYNVLTTPARLALEVVAGIQKEFSIDPRRLYIGGLSMGGFGTWAILTKYPQQFAAAVPICGYGDPNKADIVKNIPIWAFQGEKDPAVKPEKMTAMIEAVKKAGGTPKYTVYPGVGHASWVNAFLEPELLPWLFSQKAAPAK